MDEITFLETIKQLKIHSQQHETITLFELSQLFGSSFFNVVIFSAALPLVIFSSQWIVLPLTTFIVLCTIWFFFDDKVWVPDWAKAISFSSYKIQKTATFIEKACQLETWADLHSFSPKLSIANIILMGVA